MDIYLLPIFWLLWLILWTILYKFGEIRWHLSWVECWVISQLCLLFLRSCQCGCTVLFFISKDNVCRLQSFHIFTSTCYCLYISNSSRCEVVSHWHFDLHLPCGRCCRASFPLCTGHVFISFGEMPIHIWHFYNWLLFFISLCVCFYIFWIIYPLLHMIFTYFPHSM